MKTLLRRILSAGLVLFLCCSMPVSAWEGDEHDACLRKVLFGSNRVHNTDVLDAINDASYLAIDQFNGNGDSQLRELRELGIKNLPQKEDFDFTDNSQHRNWTHKGWVYDYEKTDREDKAHWTDVRKKILLETVNQKFDFGFLSGKFGRYSKQCDAFCALIYYVHIIGDHIDNETYHRSYQEIPLVKGAGNSGIIEDLLKYSPILFKNQVEDNRTYASYITRLNDLKSEIDDIYYYPSDLEDDDVYAQYHECAEKLMECLQDYVPLLIAKEPFFRKVFG